MTVIHGFETLQEQSIRELQTSAILFRHQKTGAELLSLINDDENKVFGITFRTPPTDSTGVAHILEHSVLCGSRKFPVKEPFVELLKGSLKTFLNAMTYPDKTCYPVASQNVQDLYNLIDVYLDAVFYPRLTPFIFQQEGWHFELSKADDPLIYKGVVFNEMKGAYSSPDTLLAQYSQQSLFPDTTYGLESGGAPGEIPNLTFDQFMRFHEKYYHPSNARIFFYGNDDPERRLSFLNGYLNEFEPKEIDSAVPLQPRFDRPVQFKKSFASGSEEGLKGMLTMNWLLEETTQSDHYFAMHILEYLLLGMPGSPLRKALIDSNLGEDLAGGGLESELRQMYLSTGLKGIQIANAPRIEALILDTLGGLVKNGIDQPTIEAAMNRVEFRLRENNTGSFPRGLSLMLRSLTTWLYNGNPFAPIDSEAPLKAIKKRLASEKYFFEDLIDRFFLQNPHRSTLILEPDAALAARENTEEKDRLSKARAAMDPEELHGIIDSASQLKVLQETPDSPEALSTIPSLKLADLDRHNKLIPLVSTGHHGARILHHGIFTNGIAYLDIGFNLHSLPQSVLPYAGFFGRALLEMGTEAEDYVSLSQRISRKTGGLHPASLTSAIKGSGTGAAWLFLRGKSMMDQTDSLLDILRDVLLGVQLDNRDRFLQMVLESKARQEHRLVPNGHQMVNLRLRAHFHESAWAAEQINGVSYLFFLRKLAEKAEKNWPKVLADLQEIRRLLINRNAILANITMDEADWDRFQPNLHQFLDALPAAPFQPTEWHPGESPGDEGLVIPSQINYVGKGTDLYQSGYRFHGSAHVISRFLRNSWLWDRIRVQGGAYGAFCLFDRLSGILSFVSYRDPNLLKSLDVFDQASRFLRDIDLTEGELSKGIIGTIGEIDDHKLPDASGYTSMVRYITGETDEDRQQMRDEVLQTTAGDFRAFADMLEDFKRNGLVKVLGSEGAIQEANERRPGWLDVSRIL
ncbi:insulinase family protein [Thermodesulfobacteriota bacterium]